MTIQTKFNEERKVTSNPREMLNKYIAKRVLKTWIEDFVDEDTGLVASIERNEVLFDRGTYIDQDVLAQIKFYKELIEKYPSIKAKLFNHESIHTAQMKEMLYIFFYLWYGLEWLIRWVGCGFKSKKAYRNISFEREAYSNDADLEYLKNRRLFFWLR